VEETLWFAHRFVEEYCREHSVQRFLPPISKHYLEAQPWPGNVRELHHSIERACILAKQEILGPRELDAHPMEGNGSKVTVKTNRKFEKL